MAAACVAIAMAEFSALNYQKFVGILLGTLAPRFFCGVEKPGS